MNEKLNVIAHLKTDLSQFGSKYLTSNKNFKRSNIIYDLQNYDTNLISALLNDNLIRDNYLKSVDGVRILQIDQLIDMLTYSSYIKDSYTKYANSIGLAVGNHYLYDDSDVVLNFPYKDTVLKAGMTKEDQKHDNEPFLNDVIAKPQIDELFEPKILVNAKKYDKNGNHYVNKITDEDNLMIKGNNLVALYSLLPRYAGKIKLIYIDPPFNTDTDSFRYNDRFSQSAWLTFMQNRLKIAKKLLASDGSIFVHVDWHEDAYVRLLLDNIFGRDNLINEIIWHYNSGGSYKNNFARKHDTIYWYSRSNKYNYYPNHKMVGQRRGAMKRNNMKRGIDKNGRVYYSIKSNGKEYRYYEDDIIAPDDVWNISILQQRDPERTGFNSQKPERLLARIIGATTKENDIVLDFFSGSATTQAVAMKMHRHFIGIEQMDYIKTLSIPRLEKVINKDSSGISKAVNWQGGGSFIYVQLKEHNQSYIDMLRHAKDKATLDNIYKNMKANADIQITINLTKFNKDLPTLDPATEESLLEAILDKNELYYDYYDIDDSNVRNQLSNSDYQFNKSFYKGGDK